MRIIPLTNDPDQSLSVTIPIDNKNVTVGLQLRYNTIAKYWVLTVSDANNNVLIDSIPILEQNFPAADILEPYRYLGLGTAAIVKTSSITQDAPTDTNLGTEWVLMWGDTVE